MSITYEEAQAILRYKEEMCTSDEDVKLAEKGFNKLKLIAKPSNKKCYYCGQIHETAEDSDRCLQQNGPKNGW